MFGHVLLVELFVGVRAFSELRSFNVLGNLSQFMFKVSVVQTSLADHLLSQAEQ